MRYSAYLKPLLWCSLVSFPSILATSFEGDTQQPVTVRLPTAEETECKKIYKDFLKCSVEKDWDPYILGWDVGRECLHQEYADIFTKECPTTRMEYENAEQISAEGDYSPGLLTIMGQAGDSYYGYFVVPEQSEKKVFDINCEVCSAFVEKVMKCLLPLKIEEDMDHEVPTKMEECIGDSPRGLALAGLCLDGAPWFPMEPNEYGYIVYAHASPVLKLESTYEVCYPVEGLTKFDELTKRAVTQTLILTVKDEVGGDPNAQQLTAPDGGDASAELAWEEQDETYTEEE